ncbi:MAG TPA: cytochrome ubiquinol oxidase subunit I [Bacteroidetes bacterium]|nr:cytochrome ubiquinol oxidase subunit I [Bacteroidota bacterium]
MGEIDINLVDWSRAQFALTAMYHWIFVPLTLGLSFMIAIMHTFYYKTGSMEWKNMTKFWMKIFAINFAIGVSTGIILEFEFGTNWSNYSWFVGDIFGAPLAIEGIFAFFMESTFIAIMFFGWGRVNKRFHMLSSWFTAVGSNLSALWILVANAWMQNPVGMNFNPDTARNEMLDFFEVLLSPTAVYKFLHTISQAYVLSAIVVIGISAWYLLRGRHIRFAKQSILIAAIFGLLSSIMVAGTGDGSAADVAETQPMKLAAMEGLYDGEEGAGLVLIGVLNPKKEVGNNEKAYLFNITAPKLLSLMSFRDANAFVPGINDIVYGNKKYGIVSAQERMDRGKIAINALREYNTAIKSGDKQKTKEALLLFEKHYDDFGFGYLEKAEDMVPPVAITFYAFHIMVAFGFLFIFFFALVIYLSLKDKLDNKRLLLKSAVWMIPVVYIVSELGWVVAEVGRQPWIIVNKLPVGISTSHLSTSSVQTTFFIFLGLFTTLLLVELSIMFKQVKIGPKEGGE